MWRNYLAVGVRALAKDRTYAFINIVGLGVGLAACLMLLLYVRYERSYDAWLPGAEQVYQLQSQLQDPDVGTVTDLQMSPYPAGAALRRDFPQVAASVYLLSVRPTVLRGPEALAVNKAVMVDGPLFDVLPLPLTRGDPATALRDVGSVVLSQTEARRLFGAADPLGRTITTVVRGQRADRRVTGVMRDLPGNSHLDMDYIERFDPQSFFAETPDVLTVWSTNAGWNYLRLRNGAEPAHIQAQLPAWERRNIPDVTVGEQVLNIGDIADWRLVNVRDVHLGQAQDGGQRPGNDGRTILTFLVVAFLILGMACVNFTNLATARASQRAREVALRKVLGATRLQLIGQFIGESVLVAAIAMLLALTATELLLPHLSAFLDADLRLTYLGADGMLLPIVALTLLVGAAGGVYPALYLSRFEPAQILRANKSAADGAGSGSLRNVLVVAQFAVSIGLIICTAIVYAQTIYARHLDPGFARGGLLQVEGISRKQVLPQSAAMAREMERVPGVLAATRTNLGVNTQNVIGTAVYLPGRQEPISLGDYMVDASYFDTMRIRRLAGRVFDQNRAGDIGSPGHAAKNDPAAERALAERGVNVVVNALAARRLGFDTPQAAIGKPFRAAFLRPEAGLVTATVIGVVADTRTRSIRTPVEPIIYRMGDDHLTDIVLRYDRTADPAAVQAGVERVWKRFAPDAPFAAAFSDDIVADLYASERARAQVFAAFALLAVIVACLGLFGLAAYTAERRTKEIGIRKVLGARTRDIVRLLAWQFSKPVIAANLLAWPIAWWVMRDWLNTFDARVDLGPGPFLLAGLLALAIAIGTIAGHAVRVARANPITALRYE